MGTQWPCRWRWNELTSGASGIRFFSYWWVLGSFLDGNRTGAFGVEDHPLSHRGRVRDRRGVVLGAGGVAHVAAHKCAQNNDVLGDICIASRKQDKCDAIIESVKRKSNIKGCPNDN